MSARQLFAIALVLVSACSRSEGPALCSADGVAQLRDGGVSDALIGRLCPEAAPKSPAGVETRDAGQWATKPISAPRLKTDSTSFVEKPTVIYVAVKPSGNRPAKGVWS